MRTPSEDTYVRRVLITLSLGSLAVAVLAFVFYTLHLLLVLFAGIIAALPVHSATAWLHRRTRLPFSLALAIVALSGLALVVLLFGPALPLLADQAVELVSSLPQVLERLRGLSDQYTWAKPLTDALANPLATLMNQDLGALAGRAGGVFSNTLALLGSGALVFLIALYLAADARMYVNGMLTLFPPDRRERIREVLDEVGYTLRWWLLGQSLSMSLLGITTTLVLWLLGVPLALFLGILTALMTFIPNLGPLIAGIPTVLLALTQGPLTAVAVIVFYIILQNVEGLLITPNIHRRIIALPPVLIIAAQILLSAIVGIVGVILAMPIVACGMVIIRRLYIEDVLGDRADQI